MTTGNIRNFCIIAHIDHGKSTLADRLIEATGALTDREMRAQVLDSMDIERERGITIKAQTATMSYKSQSGEIYQFNLIDTPGHVDFSYEVSRSLAACEGALVIVDASQGVEAQTVANVNLAMKHDLTLIPVINKIDLPSANPEMVREQIEEELVIPADDCLLVSAKTGVGISELLEAIVQQVPPPADHEADTLKALIIDSWFDPFLGALSLCRIMAGSMKMRQEIRMMSSGKSYEVLKIGKFTPKATDFKSLECGEVGFVCAAVKQVSETRVGDTITDNENPATTPIAGFEESKPMVFAGIFPIDSNDFELLRDSLEKLCLNDASLTVTKESSNALGMGYRVGFLGLLHMDIIQERLTREYNLALIVTAPTVVYDVYTVDGRHLQIDNPAGLPDPTKIDRIEEPYISLKVYTPQDYLGGILQILEQRRGHQVSIDYLTSEKVVVRYEIPMNEIIFDFHDKLKSISRGYASMEYEQIDPKAGDLVKLEILVNGNAVDALACVVHRSNAPARGRFLCAKLKETLSRHMFKIAIQAAIGAKVIARETLSAMRKDVTAKCYGGDISRKRKLLEKQKEGKKKMKAIGNVEIPQNAFTSILKVE